MKNSLCSGFNTLFVNKDKKHLSLGLLVRRKTSTPSTDT